MGSTLVWREPPDRPPERYEMVASFGRGRRAATGFLAYSQRAGPSVLVLCRSSDAAELGATVARALQADGFTALVLGLSDDESGQGGVAAGADYLADNWHPRLGVLCIEAGGEVAARLLGERDVDALVLCGVDDDSDLTGAPPLLTCGTEELLRRAGIDERVSDFLHYHLS